MWLQVFVLKNINCTFDYFLPFILCSCNRKMRQPYLRDLYVRSSLVNCNNLREVDEQKNGMIKVDKSASNDNTYRVWFRKLRKLNLRFKYKVLES